MKYRMQQGKTPQIKRSADGPKEGKEEGGAAAATAEGRGAAAQEETTQQVHRAKDGGTY